PALPGPLLDVPRGEREGEHAVGDDAGQPHRARHVVVLVDRVLVAAGVGVGDQVFPGDVEDPRLQLAAHQPSPRWTRVAVPVQTSAPVSSAIRLEVPMMSAPPIWRRLATVKVAVRTSPGTMARW